MNFADWFTRLLVRSDENYLDVRMQQQNAQQFRTAVARAAEDAYTKFRVSSFEFRVPDTSNPSGTFARASSWLPAELERELETRNSKLETLSLSSSNNRSPFRRAFAAGTPNSCSIKSWPICESVTEPAITSISTPRWRSNSMPPQAPTESDAQNTRPAVASRNSKSAKTDSTE